MTKKEQEKINELCMTEMDKAMAELNGETDIRNAAQLRRCSAWVYNTPSYYILRSYDTFIGCINKQSGNSFDVLRIVYGYTASSGKQFSKFIQDYSGWAVSHYCAR